MLAKDAFQVCVVDISSHQMVLLSWRKQGNSCLRDSDRSRPHCSQQETRALALFVEASSHWMRQMAAAVSYVIVSLGLQGF